MSQTELFPTRRVETVSALNTRIRDTLQTDFDQVWVSGEISDLARPQSGHVYFSLKDHQGQIRAVMWRSVASRLLFDLEDGMQVVCEGGVDVYPPRGTYQLIVRQLEPLGVGALQLALNRLREKLAAEGLFLPHHKQTLPRFPQHVAVVTSPTGAAIRDFLEVVRRRWRDCHVTVIPSRVQGAEAASEIVAAIGAAHRLQPRPDVLVVTRGGGSLEDLWCFNEEPVVRAVFAARIPTVSAIGHEIDVTLTDLVADVRALTPTEAAERIVPDRQEVRSQLVHQQAALRQALRRIVQAARGRVDQLASRPVLRRPEDRLHDLSRQIDDLQQRMTRGMQLRMTRQRDRLQGMAEQLQSLSPLNVLGRGYSLTHQDDGTLLRDVNQLQTGQMIHTRLSHGQVFSRVEQLLDDARPMDDM